VRQLLTAKFKGLLNGQGHGKNTNSADKKRGGVRGM